MSSCESKLTPGNPYHEYWAELPGSQQMRQCSKKWQWKPAGGWMLWRMPRGGNTGRTQPGQQGGCCPRGWDGLGGMFRLGHSLCAPFSCLLARAVAGVSKDAAVQAVVGGVSSSYTELFLTKRHHWLTCKTSWHAKTKGEPSRNISTLLPPHAFLFMLHIKFLNHMVLLCVLLSSI